MFSLICPQCASELSLSPRRLMVRVDAERPSEGELMFTCLGCHRTSAVPLDAAAVAALVSSGVTFLSLTVPVVEHPEARPDGPALTTDDLLDLHAELGRDAWFEDIVE